MEAKMEHMVLMYARGKYGYGKDGKDGKGGKDAKGDDDEKGDGYDIPASTNEMNPTMPAPHVVPGAFLHGNTLDAWETSRRFAPDPQWEPDDYWADRLTFNLSSSNQPESSKGRYDDDYSYGKSKPGKGKGKPGKGKPGKGKTGKGKGKPGKGKGKAWK